MRCGSEWTGRNSGQRYRSDGILIAHFKNPNGQAGAHAQVLSMLAQLSPARGDLRSSRMPYTAGKRRRPSEAWNSLLLSVLRRALLQNHRSLLQDLWCCSQDCVMKGIINGQVVMVPRFQTFVAQSQAQEFAFMPLESR